MAWAKWYFVSYILTVKTLPIKVKAANEQEALDVFRDMVAQGEIPDEEERTVQYIINVKLKSF